MHDRLTGLFPAVHTPFHEDGSLNAEVVEQQAELFLRAGVAGVFVAGSTGECHSLTVDERLQLARRWVDVASGTSLKVLVHVGHNSLPNAVEMAAQAGQIGADGIAAMAPSYFLPASLDDLLDFCRPIAAAAPELPFYYYDIPGMTHVRFPSVDVLRDGSRRIANLCGVKFSNPDLRQLQACVELEDGRFDVLFGSDEALLAGLTLGSRGAIGCTYNFAAPLYHQLIAAFDRGDLAQARKLQLKSVALVDTLARYGFLGAAKWTMSLVGIDCGPARSPLRNLDLSQQESLRRELLEGRLLEPAMQAESAPVSP